MAAAGTRTTATGGRAIAYTTLSVPRPPHARLNQRGRRRGGTQVPDRRPQNCCATAAAGTRTTATDG